MENGCLSSQLPAFERTEFVKLKGFLPEVFGKGLQEKKTVSHRAELYRLSFRSDPTAV